MKTTSVPPAPPLAELDVDPDAPATDEELREAAALRDALGDPTRAHDGAALARAVVLAHAPASRPLDAAEHEAIVQQALGGEGVVSLAVARERRTRRTRQTLLAAGVSALALAAAVLVFRDGAPEPVAALDAQAPLRARSSQPLFHEPFAPRGGASARVDRIASARAGDLRENMFSRWDVR